MQPKVALLLFLSCLLVAGSLAPPPPPYLHQIFRESQASHDISGGSNFNSPSGASDDHGKTPKASKSEAKCGYDSCDLGKPDMINVHIVPHTHDDVGWLKTVDQYFYGSRNNIQHAGVQYILDSSIQELIRNPERRFIYVEIAFFYRWWNQQHDHMRHVVKQLVDEGRLQFILGGWSMNDEASTHYTAIVDQHTRGLRFLNENFGECGRPLSSWQIDPFGHSREQASLFAQMGYDSLFFMRLDHQEKDRRLKTRTMEMMWRGSDDLKEKSDLFTSILYESYCPPSGFCFDSQCSDDPIMDDPNLYDYNVQKRVNDFLDYVKRHSQHYTSNHILVPMGCDFQFENANVNFKNLDKLIKYVNERQVNGSKVNLIYSTPSCYTYAVNKANLTYTWKLDDFFPYASADHSYWTGYFVSRASLKGYVRELNNRLQGVQQLAVLSGLENEQAVEYRIDTLRRAMGVAQHHDAVSGTEKQHVAYDYAKRLSVGANDALEVISMSLNRLMQHSGLDDTPFSTCDLLNISRCAGFSEERKPFNLVVYNSLAWRDYRYLRLPINCGVGWKVSRLQAGGDIIPVDVQVNSVTQRTKSIPERGNTSADCELIFRTNTSALGFSTYTFQPATHGWIRRKITPVETPSPFNDRIFIENDVVRLDFDSQTQSTMSIIDKRTNVSLPFHQSMRYYFGFNEEKGQPSGAYIFRPEDGSVPQIFSNVQITAIVKGKLVQEIHQTFDSWATQVFRIYQGEETIEVEWTVGPIPDDDNKGREVILNYDTSLVTFGMFFTDANGRQMIMRQKDARPSVSDFNQTEPVAGNYYPINSRILLTDVQQKQAFMVLTDRSQGGGSIKDGQLEIMVHRRTMKDDYFGVGEPLKEQGSNDKGLIVRGKHYLLSGTLTHIQQLHRTEAMRIFHQPLALFTSQTDSQQFARVPEWSGVRQEFPANLHLMTLDNWRGNKKLLRLEHLYESREEVNGSKPVTVQLNKLFTAFNIVDANELTLAANQNLSSSQRLVWNAESSLSKGHKKVDDNVRYSVPGAISVTLSPMEIRTFEITTNP